MCECVCAVINRLCSRHSFPTAIRVRCSCSRCCFGAAVWQLFALTVRCTSPNSFYLPALIRRLWLPSLLLCQWVFGIIPYLPLLAGGCSHTLLQWLCFAPLLVVAFSCKPRIATFAFFSMDAFAAVVAVYIIKFCVNCCCPATTSIQRQLHRVFAAYLPSLHTFCGAESRRWVPALKLVLFALTIASAMQQLLLKLKSLLLCCLLLL